MFINAVHDFLETVFQKQIDKPPDNTTLSDTAKAAI